MPRQARIDVPGQICHVMARGIERRQIFLDKEDYEDFRGRMAVWLNKTGARCLAWCLMPNHIHFLVLRAGRPLSELMHRVMTGYAVSFNLRHSRAGHLFQNRYKAIVCELEGYFLEVAPYIHLNPLRAGLVPDVDALKNYPWCGHKCAVTGLPDELLDRDALLAHFGDTESVAVGKYIAKIREKAEEDFPVDLSGGGLQRSCLAGRGGHRAFRAVEAALSDQRVLGDSRFVESVLRAADEEMVTPKKTRAEVMAEVEGLTGVARADILRRTRERGPASARALYCHLAREAAGCSIAELSEELGLTCSAVCKLAFKGRSLAESPK